MKILITGGAGFFGLHMTKKCVAEGHDVTLLDIAKYDSSEYDPSVKLVRGDVRDTEKMDKLIAETDFIIHAAAALPLEKRKEIFSTNVDGTKNVLELANKHKIKRFVMISSTAVYGVPDHHPLYEHDEMIGVGNYGESKIAGEEICKEFRDKGLYITIIRPKTFIGTHRLGVFQILYDWVEGNHRIPTIGKGNNRYQLLEVDDLADAVYLAVSCEDDKANDVFNVGAVSELTQNDYLGGLIEHAGKLGNFKPKGMMHTPVWLVIPALMLFEWLRISPLYKWVYGTAHTESFVSVEKIQKTLGWKPNFDEREALIRSYDWYQENKEKLTGETGTGHRVAWAQGILGLFKKIL